MLDLISKEHNNLVDYSHEPTRSLERSIVEYKDQRCQTEKINPKEKKEQLLL
jgi:hypothetical protein